MPEIAEREAKDYQCLAVPLLRRSSERLDRSRFRRGQCRLASRELREVPLLGDENAPWRVVARLSGPDEMIFFTPS